jgi:hypothetical protein
MCGLLLSAGVCSFAAGQTRIAEGGSCAGLTVFGPKDSLNQAGLELENKDLRVRVNAKGPDLHVQVAPDLSWKQTTNAAQRVGWIRVFSCEDGSLLQSLEVESLAGPELFLRFFQVGDINFDGYVDVAVLSESGAQWGRQQWWVFSPAEGKFISNEFTEAIGKVTANGLVLDPEKRQVLAGHLTQLTGCGDTKDIYGVEQDRLVEVHAEEVAVSPRGCTLTTRDRVNGQMQVTNVQHFPPYDQPARP